MKNRKEVMSKMNHHIFTPDLNREYLEFERAEGVYLYDKTGKSYMDMSSGPCAVSIGYGRKDMAEALKDQASKLHFSYRAYSVNPATIEAAQKLNEMTGYEKFLFVGGGSEANECAVRIARLYQLAKGNKSKYKVLGKWMSYHGGTHFTMSLGANLKSRTQFDDLIQEKGHIPPSYCYRCWYGEKAETCSLQCAQALEDEILKQGPETVSAFITEPISGSSLCAGYCQREDYLKQIQEICHKYDVLLIFDEVISGGGRTGKFLSQEHFGVKADLATMAKGITGLYIPAGAVACSSEVSEVISEKFKRDAFPMAFTSTNQPMMARALVETLEIMKKEKLIESAAVVGKYLKEKLEAMADRHPSIGHVNGIGLLLGIEFVKDKKTKEIMPASTGYARQLHMEGLKNGLILLHFGCDNFAEDRKNQLIIERYKNYDIDKGIRGDGALIGPPLISTKEDIDQFVEIYDKVITVVEKKNGLA